MDVVSITAFMHDWEVFEAILCSLSHLLATPLVNLVDSLYGLL
jgi:hypothetical protein